MTLHPEVMSEKQGRLLPRLGAAVTDQGFHLGGGTAVALHLGHRMSVDLDWFTGRAFKPLDLLGQLRDLGLEPTGVTTDEGTLHAVIDGVRTTFLEYRYPMVEEPVEWTEGQCLLASLRDLGAAKLSAIAGRGARRDFIDLHAIVRAGSSLTSLLEAYAFRFGVPERGHLLRSLTYFDDAEEERMPTLLRAMAWEEIRSDLERWVRELLGG